MRHYCAPYPSRMMINMCCHLRAIWNLSQKAADLAFWQGIKHTEIERIKKLLQDTKPTIRGQIYCLRKSQPRARQWVSLKPETYIDDLFCMKTKDYTLAKAILKFLERPEQEFGKEYSTTSTRV